MTHDPNEKVGLSGSGDGVAVWRGEQIVTRLTWPRAQMLRDLLDEALSCRTGAEGFADGVLRDLDLDEESVEAVRPSVEGWFDRWATPPDDGDRAVPGRES